MAERRTLICDVCGFEEPLDRANSWFGAIERDPVDSRKSLELFHLFPADEIPPEWGAENINHLCGATCATRKVAEFLGQGAEVLQ